MAKCRPTILYSLETWRFLEKGTSNDSGIVEVHNVRRLLLAICSEALDKICSYIQDKQPFDGFSEILNFLTLNEPK